jgi:hypothetical protein
MAFFWELTRHGLGLGLLYRLWDRAFRQGAWFRSARYVEIRLLHRSLVIMRRCAPCRRLEADPAHASMLSDHPAAEACGCYAQPGLPVPMFRHARYRPGLTWSTVRACFMSTISTIRLDVKIPPCSLFAFVGGATLPRPCEPRRGKLVSITSWSCPQLGTCVVRTGAKVELLDPLDHFSSSLCS